MTRMKHNLLITILAIVVASCGAPEEKTTETNESSYSENAIETRIGTLDFTHDFENGYPTNETVEMLYDELDFQRACQAYI